MAARRDRALRRREHLAGDQSAGLYMENTVRGPLILLPSNVGLFRETVIKHELAHYVASGFLPRSPTWLHEGLAQVMQTADYDTEKGEILFGDFAAANEIDPDGARLNRVRAAGASDEQ